VSIAPRLTGSFRAQQCEERVRWRNQRYQALATPAANTDIEVHNRQSKPPAEFARRVDFPLLSSLGTTRLTLCTICYRRRRRPTEPRLAPISLRLPPLKS
jgi:hypothetical protein